MNGVSGITTEEDVKKIVGEETKKINYLLAGVIVVLFVGFLTLLFALAALLVSAWQNRAPSYQDLINVVQSQNAKIDFIYSVMHIAPR